MFLGLFKRVSRPFCGRFQPCRSGSGLVGGLLVVVAETQLPSPLLLVLLFVGLVAILLAESAIRRAGER